jgi:hypothetical protein
LIAAPAVEAAQMRIPKTGRDYQFHHRNAERLSARVTEDPFGGGIPLSNRSAAVYGDNRIEGGINYRRIYIASIPHRRRF